ncbi:MAG: hypothetical protein LBB09_01630 [Rickettsiales bacterium]|nr:hypothetical protein [Rickettsiales bacterium]
MGDSDGDGVRDGASDGGIIGEMGADLSSLNFSRLDLGAAGCFFDGCDLLSADELRTPPLTFLPPPNTRLIICFGAEYNRNFMFFLAYFTL